MIARLMRLKLSDLPRPDRKPCPYDPVIRALVEWERMRGEGR